MSATPSGPVDPADRRVRVLLADDHPVVRTGLRAVLDLFDDLVVIAEASTPEEALGLARAHPVDVVLLDLQFAHGTSLGVIADLVGSPYAPAVVVLTTYDTEADVLQALDAGALGYLLKDAPAEELAESVRGAARGETVLAPRVAQRLLRRQLRPAAALTSRELEVLEQVALGLSNDEIGSSLFLSRATIKSHLVHIFDKLGVENRTAAVAKARAAGLLR